MFDILMKYVCIPFGYIMKLCWQLVGNYGAAILVFTLVSKLILLPVSIWVHNNSIKMVRIQPDINFLKVKYYGDPDTIAGEQAELFKREKYSPAASIVSLVLQLFFLSAIIQIIYHPLTYIVGLSAETVGALGAQFGVDMAASAAEIDIVKLIQQTSSVVIDAATDARISALEFGFLGFDISQVASETWGKNILVPLIAGLSAWLFCWSQNQMNVLQHEQSKLSQYGMTVFSVGLSLYLGFFVPAGIALYWVASNLFAILQQVLLNALVPPKKHVDYAALEESRRALAAIEALDNGRGERARELKKREKEDYKRFFRVANKHIVIYSEKSGFYKYFEALMKELFALSNVTIHYVTGDPDDIIFGLAQTNPKLRAYYIGNKKLITLMMKMDADMVLMTTPDLEKYYIKRSLVRKDIEYIYVPHDPMSVHMGLRENALDHFDTIFCTGPHVEREVRATEAAYSLPAKTLVPFGYPLSEKLRELGESNVPDHRGGRQKILIAPSWQEDNVLDSCLDGLVDKLYGEKYRLVVRPHPEYVKRYGDRMRAVTEKYAHLVGEGLEFELDFSKNSSIYDSDLMITDWSGISCEFCYATGRPALFINTAMKVENPNWQKIDCVPVEISLRNRIGVAIDKDGLATVDETVDTLIRETENYRSKIDEAYREHFFNIGHSAHVGALYILGQLRKRQNLK